MGTSVHPPKVRPPCGSQAGLKEGHSQAGLKEGHSMAKVMNLFYAKIEDSGLPGLLPTYRLLVLL